MTSPSRRTHKPVQSIRIKARIEGSSAELLPLKKKLAGAKMSGGALHVSIVTSDPGDAIEGLRNIGDATKRATKNPKGFK